MTWLSRQIISIVVAADGVIVIVVEADEVNDVVVMNMYI
jgi:hypothetical protein